ncbi:hypothetical protein MUP95_06305 [bacterium]|nr:hypothetical protein [bacterium]
MKKRLVFRFKKSLYILFRVDLKALWMAFFCPHVIHGHLKDRLADALLLAESGYCDYCRED